MEILTFKKYGMNIKLNGNTALIGPENCGKTTVFKLLTNKVKNDSVYLGKKRLNSYKLDFLRKNIMCVFDIEDFNTDYVKDELAYFLKKFKVDSKEISLRVAHITHYFYIEDIIDVRINSLNVEEKSLIKILSFLIVSPLVFGVDNLFGYISLDNFINILNYAKERNIAIIYATTDIEKTNYADEVHIINNFKSVKSGSCKEVFKDRLIRQLSLEKPFIIEMNEFLHDYELLNSDFVSINDGVMKLWK